MMKQKKIYIEGFTLLEILISVGILAVVGVLITQVFFSVTRTSSKAEKLRDIKQNGDFVLDVMERYIRNASESKIFCETGLDSSNSATFRSRNGTETRYACVSDGNAARIASISAAGVAYLSNGNYSISASGDSLCDDSTFTFSCPDVSGLKTPIKIRFILGQRGQPESVYDTASTIFETSVTLRN